jgi:hypothetical protein
MLSRRPTVIVRTKHHMQLSVRHHAKPFSEHPSQLKTSDVIANYVLVRQPDHLSTVTNEAYTPH